MNYEWLGLVLTYCLFTLSLLGVTTGGYLMYVTTVQFILQKSVGWLVFSTFGLACILVSLLCLLVIVPTLLNVA